MVVLVYGLPILEAYRNGMEFYDSIRREPNITLEELRRYLAFKTLKEVVENSIFGGGESSDDPSSLLFSAIAAGHMPVYSEVMRDSSDVRSGEPPADDKQVMLLQRTPNLGFRDVSTTLGELKEEHTSFLYFSGNRIPAIRQIT